jgi:hypothetical protein
MYIYKQRRGKEFGMFFKEGEVGEEQKKFFFVFQELTGWHKRFLEKNCIEMARLEYKRKAKVMITEHWY